MTFTPEQRQTARDIRDRMLGKNVVRTETFESESTPGKEYTVQHYADGTKSCNCPAWTRRVAKDGSRSDSLRPLRKPLRPLR